MKKNLLFLLLFLISLNLMAQAPKQEEKLEAPQTELVSPRATMQIFLKAMKRVKQGETKAIIDAIETLNLSHLDPATRVDSGALAARRLVRTIDKIEYIDYASIPDYTKGPTWVFRKRNVTYQDQSVSVEISIGQDQEGAWKFTPRTVDTIEFFEAALRNKKNVSGAIELRTWKTLIKEKMPNWMGNKTFILKNGQWLGLLIILILAFILSKFIEIALGFYARRFFTKAHLVLGKGRQKNFTLPFAVSTMALIWTFGIRALELDDAVFAVFLRAGYVILTIGCVWASHRLVDIVSFYFENMARESENKFDDILVPLLRKAAKVFVLCVGVVFIGHSLTLNVTNIIAGLGIGGLAVALAAKDTLSNLFGSLTVLLDRPFQIGDWVKIGNDVEGIIEEVGFRSTRVRTFYNSLISVPNNQLTNTHIDNFGRRQYRRFSTSIGVQYDTPPEKIEAFCEGIRQIVLTHKFTRKDYFHVYFNNFNNCSLDILLYVFFEVPDWTKELSEKHRLLIDILRLGNDMGIQFAFPTQTVHLYKEEHLKRDPLEKDPYEAGKEWGRKIASRTITMQNPRSGVTGEHKDFEQDRYDL